MPCVNLLLRDVRTIIGVSLVAQAFDADLELFPETEPPHSRTSGFLS